ncbi:peptidase C39 family protein [Pseudomonas typographi]|uniref:peptidase C39 family protein n=1 Tax=Pseudomonas typographi TaxID=2715964 RepID=UPI0016833E75|nr:peptidase C39 family protein [Pseudomonas typographi]MBD1553577.1 peptidase C39 family protein [Pseudomonas typographi]MBD1587275.1 peptidase C39 family protein [Pseudomonas typographi]
MAPQYSPFVYRLRLAAGLALALAMAGCSSKPAPLVPPTPIAGLPDKVELGGVPFYRGRDDQSAPEVLAAALRQQGVTVTPGLVEPALKLDQQHGQLNEAISNAAREYGMVVYPLEPKLEALMFQVAAGFPVLVRYDEGSMFWSQPRYALLVGFDRYHKEVILRAGEQRRLRMPISDFTSAWAKQQHWAVLVQSPRQLPAHVDATRWREAAGKLAQAGQEQAAAQATRTLEAR